MTDWSDPLEADPIADIRSMAEYVREQSGYSPQVIPMSAATFEAYARFQVWFSVMVERLDALPRRRFITRAAFKRELYGPTWKRGRFGRWWYRLKARHLIEEWD